MVQALSDRVRAKAVTVFGFDRDAQFESAAQINQLLLDKRIPGNYKARKQKLRKVSGGLYEIVCVVVGQDIGFIFCHPMRKGLLVGRFDFIEMLFKRSLNQVQVFGHLP
jgi:hypothetical protein